MSPLPIPMLSALVFAPAIGALVVASLPEDRARLRRVVALIFSLASFAMAFILVLDRRPEDVIRDSLVERYSWVSMFGASYELGLDGLSILLTAWVSLLALVALVSERSEETDRSATVLVLCCESALLGLFLARDVFLLLAFLGAALASLALLLGRGSPSSMRRFFFFQAVGLVLLLGLAAVLSHLSYLQTGFASGALARWEGLVLFPEFETRCFFVGAAAIAFLAPQLPVLFWLPGALFALSTSGRILMTGGYSLVGGYLLFRFVLQLVPRGAEEGSSSLLAFALIGLVFVAIAPWQSDGKGLSWERLLVAYQSLVLLGLLAFHEEGIAAALVLLLHQAGALTALTLCTAETDATNREISAGVMEKTLFALSCASLFVIPSIGRVLSAHWARSPFVTAAVFLGAIVLALRVLRWALNWSRRDHLWPARRRVVLLPVLVYCLWLASSSQAWELRFGELARGLVPRLSGAMEQVEVDP
jgi:NADH-quinone oxidoreductase subunit M